MEGQLFEGDPPSFQTQQITAYKKTGTLKLEKSTLGSGFYFPELTKDDMKDVLKLTQAMFAMVEHKD